MSAIDVVFFLLLAAGAAAFGWTVGHRANRGRADEAASASRAAEEALAERERTSRESRRLQDLILASMDDGVVLFDAQGRTVFANEASRWLLTVVPDDLAALLPTELQRAAAQAGETGSIVEAEAETGTPLRILRATATPAGDEGAVLLVIRDVTESLRLDAIRRDFVTNASHELKTPAAAIQAAAETLQHAAKDDPAAVPRFAAQLERESLRLSRIIADLLDLSRLESGDGGDELLTVDTLARDECERLEDQVQAAGLTLTVHSESAALVRGSARDLSLLVRNLVDNAIRYTKPGGSIEVVVRQGEGAVIVGVTDTGAGIPSRDLPRIFERFYRVDRARSRETGGTGLGLAIVKHVAENLGGSVAVSSELGLGTTFEVRLPAVASG